MARLETKRLEYFIGIDMIRAVVVARGDLDADLALFGKFGLDDFLTNRAISMIV